MLVSVCTSLKNAVPDMELGIIYCDVKNTPHDEKLWELIEDKIDDLRKKYSINTIKERYPIRATREAYKKLGKDPSRYRPSAEALARRVLQGKGLYRISTLVDIINLVSLDSGFSIGGFDAGKIEGDIVATIGIENEPFEAIGRGQLNVGGLPVYRDEQGAIGTPTSDTVRTSISLDTSSVLMIINGYGGKEGLNDAVKLASKLMEVHGDGKNFKTAFI
ncbi:MAG: B3/4 domain-containing protein [Bacteroidales bacterium]